MFKHVFPALRANQVISGACAFIMVGACAVFGSPAQGQAINGLAIRVLQAGDSGTTQVAVDFGRAKSAEVPQEISLKSIPLAGGGTGDFDLTKFDVFTANAELTVTDSDDTTHPLKAPNMAFYRGTMKTDPNQTACLAVENGTNVKLFVLNKNGESSVIDKAAPSKQRNAPAGYFLRQLKKPQMPLDCKELAIPGDQTDYSKLELQGAKDRMKESAIQINQARSKSKKKKNKNQMVRLPVIQMMIDVDYEGFQYSFHSDTAEAATYMATILAIDSSIYQRDIGAAVMINRFNIWTTQDLITSVPKEVALTRDLIMENWQKYVKSTRPGYVYDAAFFSTGFNFGGLGYLSGLCTSDYRFMMGGTLNYNDGFFSTYTYDINLVAHELGHLCGSTHTHCFNPPIDCCFDEEGCSYCTQIVPQPGTIMSYCDQILLYFHPRCIDVMKAFLKKAPCLDTFVELPPPDNSAPDFQGTLGKIKISGQSGNFTISGQLAVQNTGETVAGKGIQVVFYISQDGILSQDDQALQSVFLKKDLKGKKGQKVKFKVTSSAVTASGLYVIAWINPGGEAGELNTSNNTVFAPLN